MRKLAVKGAYVPTLWTWKKSCKGVLYRIFLQGFFLFIEVVFIIDILFKGDLYEGN